MRPPARCYYCDGPADAHLDACPILDVERERAEAKANEPTVKRIEVHFCDRVARPDAACGICDGTEPDTEEIEPDFVIKRSGSPYIATATEWSHLDDAKWIRMIEAWTNKRKGAAK